MSPPFSSFCAVRGCHRNQPHIHIRLEDHIRERLEAFAYRDGYSLTDALIRICRLAEREMRIRPRMKNGNGVVFVTEELDKEFNARESPLTVKRLKNCRPVTEPNLVALKVVLKCENGSSLPKLLSYLESLPSAIP